MKMRAKTTQGVFRTGLSLLYGRTNTMLGSVRFYEMEILERRGLRAVKKLDALREMRKETERVLSRRTLPV
jgi:hypothetical protein